MRTAAVLTALTLALLITPGCVPKSSFKGPANPLDDALYYYEEDSGGKKWGISQSWSQDSNEIDRKILDQAPDRVPSRVLMDQDSTVHILVNPASLPADAAAGRELPADLLDRKQGMVRALEQIEAVVAARKEAVDAYAAGNLDTFLEGKKRFGAAQNALINGLTAIWPKDSEDPEKRKAYGDLLAAHDPPRYERLQVFLQARIDEIGQRDREIEESLSARAHFLRIEAVLRKEGGGQDPIKLHLEGYDDLRKGDFRPSDRAGLDLSDDERKRLQEHVDATRDLVSTAERVRRGELSLREGLKQAIPLLSPRLGALMPRIEDLEARLDSENLGARLDRARTLAGELVESASSELGDLTGSFSAQIASLPEKVRSELEREATEALQLESLLEDAKKLIDGWTHVTPASQFRLIADTKAFASGLPELPGRVTALGEGAGEILVTLARNELSGMEEDARSAFTGFLESGNEKTDELRELTAGFRRDVEDLIHLGRDMAAAVGITQVDAVAVGTSPPGGLKVPLDELQNTFFDLEYAPRQRGDRIEVSATLYRGAGDESDEIVAHTSANFAVSRFGYYGKLSPAVVLVKPSELEGSDDGFRFAPTLSWMHHYMPRPDQGGFWASLMRGLRPALGIHSAFLSFESEDPQTSEPTGDAIQIGIGATLSFWENRLQAGAGYNLMAEEAEEGRTYYFIGTDLIGLLQVMQAGGSGGS